MLISHSFFYLLWPPMSTQDEFMYVHVPVRLYVCMYVPIYASMCMYLCIKTRIYAHTLIMMIKSIKHQSYHYYT